jgi:1-acyl-sn-glycerol-3-phosphate acyltransferase
MQAVLSVWSWFAIGVTVITGFFIQLLLAVTIPFDKRRWVCGRFFRSMGTFAARLVPQWHFRTVGNVPRHIAGRTVVVSNHSSQADPFLISLLPWEMKWLGKASLFKIPVVGWMMWLAGDIPVHRGRARSANDAMRKCAEWLDKGVPVMIFPEGTRSLDDDLLPFKDGAFRLAIETGSEVLPIAVEGTRAALPKHSWQLGKARAEVMVGTPISPQGRHIDELRDLARAQIEGMLRTLRGATSATRSQPAPAADSHPAAS